MKRILALALLATLLGACAGMDVQSDNAIFSTAQDQVLLFSEEQEIEMGRQGAQEWAAKYPAAGAEAQAYVAGLGLRLAKASARPGLPWSFKAVRSAEANAFALPGGQVFITTGLLTKLKDEAELAAVLGHEIGHIERQHALKRVQRQMVLQYGADLLAAFGGKRAALLKTASGLASNLLILRNTRENELEADEAGMRLSAAVGLAPEAMVGVQETLMAMAGGKGNAIQEMLSSHPLSENRISQARRLLPRYQGPAERGLGRYQAALKGL